MIQLSSEEIALIKKNRMLAQESRAEFMAIAHAVADATGIPFSAITGVTRGTPETCAARALLCRIAFDRGFSHRAIAQFIRRDRTSVIHAISTTRKSGE